MKIKNLTKAANRIKKAIAQKERIVLYGDADLDGVTSVLIAQEAVKSLGGNIVAYYFPEREKEGYGVTPKALERLKQYVPGLLVTFDLGISNFKEIPMAKKLGFDVIVVDHHKVLDKLPQADIIVDPKQPGDRYPFKEFAACGLSLQLAKAILGKNLSDALYQSMVELAALGTIADMMVREQDNVKIIQDGLDAISYSWRPGIRAFLESDIFGSDARLEDKVQQMISILNVRDTKNREPGAFRLLLCPSLQKARLMVEDFAEKNKIRREQINWAADEVRTRIFHKKEDSLVFEGSEHFEFELLGAAASIISQETQKPAFIFKKSKKGILGSVRAPLGYDTVKAMQHCDQFLETYGGHPQASGFQTSPEKEKDLMMCLLEYFQKNK
ncbi:MAG: DHH family phosphoesterase [Patescibacteria group bacterium]